MSTRPYSYPHRVATLMRMLREAAEKGEPCPSNSTIADVLDMHESGIALLFQHLVQAGLVTIDRAGDGANTRRIVTAADGSWQTADRPTNPNSHDPRRGRQNTPRRRCLTCLEPFQPRHRLNFRCCGEGAVA